MKKEQEHLTPVEEPVKRQLRLPGFAKVLVAAVVIVGVYTLGVGVGSGNISLARDRFKASDKTAQLPANLDYSSVEKVYDTLRSDYDGDLDQTKLMDGLKKGLAAAAEDPYTEYMNNKEAKEFKDELNGTFSGIGAELGKQESAIIIVSPISGFPAEKAGLRPKDVIAEIDGVSTYDISVSDAVTKIRGEVGTKVKLKIIRGGSEELDVEITREKIVIPSVESKVLEGNIGYIKISTFAEDTADLTAKAATSLKNSNVKGVVLDLRGNPGGLLDAAVDVSSLWLPKGKTVLEEKHNGLTIRTYKSNGPATLAGIPTIVLINEGSASASEITAGALKDNDAATLVGVKSFGKGVVQQLEELPDGGQLKVTIAKWYTPKGKNINKEGISPDTEVKRTDDDYKNNKDPQLDAATSQLNK